jgi:hypothetical protein
MSQVPVTLVSVAAALLFAACNALPRPVDETATPFSPLADVVRENGWTEGIDEIPVDTRFWKAAEVAEYGLAFRYPPGWRLVREWTPSETEVVYAVTAPSHARQTLEARGQPPFGGGFVTLRVMVGGNASSPSCPDMQEDLVAGQDTPVCWEFRSGVKYIVLGTLGGEWDGVPMAIQVVLVNPFDLTDEATLRAIVHSIEFAPR